MSEPPTSRAGRHLGIPHIYRALAAFVRRPQLPAAFEPFGWRAIGEVAWLVLLNLALAVSLALALGQLGETIAVDGPDFSVLTERGPWFALAMGGLVLPVGEEIVFRGWIAGRGRVLAIVALALVALTAIGVLSESGAPPWSMVLVGAAWVALSVAIAWRGGDPSVARGMKAAFPAIYVGQAIVFAGFHLSNYSETRPAVALFVAPQLVAGLILGFARVRFGMWANIAIHAVSNALFLTVMLAA